MPADKKIPKIIYANRLNLSGLYKNTPVRLRWDAETSCWWSADGNFCIYKLGYDEHGACHDFASENKQEVEIWTKGILTTIKAIGQWAH